ncbi:hypothetical protein ACFX2I_001858 [Malus domestica]
MASAAVWGFQTKMALFFFSLLLNLFRFFGKIFLVSFRHDMSSPTNDSCCSSPPPPSGEINKISKINGDDLKFDDFDDGEASKPNFVFKFEFQTRELLSRINGGNNANGDSAFSEEYEFLAEKFNKMKAAENVNCFMEEAKAASFNVEEVHEETP